MLKNKKASVQDVALIIVIIFSLAVLGLVSKTAFNEFNNKVSTNPNINNSQVTIDALNAGYEITNKYDYIIFSVFMGLVIALIITGWLVGGNPIFAFLYFIAIVIITVVAIVFSNVWWRISTNTVFNTALTEMPITDFLISNIHIVTPIIGFVGILVMFAKPFTGQYD